MPSMGLASFFHHCHHCRYRSHHNCYHKFSEMRFFLHLTPLPTLYPGKQLKPNSEAMPLYSNINISASLLQTCTDIKTLEQLHAHILITGLSQTATLGSKLVNMYAKCGRLENARLVFDKLHDRNVFIWNAIIGGYAGSNPCKEAVTLYYQMRQTSIQPDKFTFSSVLKACASLSALQEGKEIHYHIVKTGFESDVFVGSALIHMYSKCGSTLYARKVFDKIPRRDVVLWNAMIAGYTHNRDASEALTLLSEMQSTDVKPNSITMLSVLSACAYLGALHQGDSIHGFIIKNGFESSIFVGTALIDMYVRCGNIENARRVFDKISKTDVVSWNAMIAGYAYNGHVNEALTLISEMHLMDIKPNSITMVSVLPACARLGSLRQGKCIHAYVIRSGFESDTSVVNSLITMYANCGNINRARHMFDKMSKRDMVSWTAMIAAYAQIRHANEALTLFHQMQLANLTPDLVTVVSLLSACAYLGALQQGKWIHEYLTRSGFESDVSVETSLVDMYSKCGMTEDARHVFDKMSNRNVVTWTAMISGYIQNGYADEALILFHQMQQEDITPDSATIVSVLLACAHLGALKQGELVHCYIIRSGFEPDVSVGNSLADMYAKNGNIEIARKLFDKMLIRDVISWNVMIVGYTQNGHANEALTLFHQMQLANMKPNEITMVTVLSACAQLEALHQGSCIHNSIVKSGFELCVFVQTALIDMYAKCGSTEIARHVFDQMPERDVASWNAVIAGYAQEGYANEALMLFHEMQLADTPPDSTTLVSVLAVCAYIGALEHGKWIHDYIVKHKFDSDVFVGTALIDMYAKCGSIVIARKLFDNMTNRDLVVWSAMIAGYGMHGHGEDALTLFSQMQQTGMKPNHITFIAVLSACSHAGLVEDGWQYFESMTHDYSITPRVEHYACMVDLLGRAGLLDEAQDFIQKMPLEPDADVWGALLGACRIHCNLELGEHVAERLFDLDPENAGHHVLLSNLYAAAGRWNDAANVRRMMKGRGLKKTPGFSLIEVNNRVHAFLVGD
eukprot:Gb_09406 [translate_table: standard]